jgi:hypothetical protein
MGKVIFCTIKIDYLVKQVFPNLELKCWNKFLFCEVCPCSIESAATWVYLWGQAASCENIWLEHVKSGTKNRCMR